MLSCHAQHSGQLSYLPTIGYAESGCKGTTFFPSGQRFSPFFSSNPVLGCHFKPSPPHSYWLPLKMIFSTTAASAMLTPPSPLASAAITSKLAGALPRM